MAKEMRHREGTPPKAHSFKLAGKPPLAEWDIYFISLGESKAGRKFLTLKLVYASGKIRGAANYWLGYDVEKGRLVDNTDKRRMAMRTWNCDVVVSTLEKTSATYLEKVDAGELPLTLVKPRTAGEEYDAALAAAEKVGQRLARAKTALAAEKGDLDIFT